MAERLGLSGHDQLQHFIASPAWDDAPLWTELGRQADQKLGGPDTLLVIDDTALPKQGTHSVGGARQYCGALGEPPWVSRRLQLLRGWSHDEANSPFFA